MKGSLDSNFWKTDRNGPHERLMKPNSRKIGRKGPHGKVYEDQLSV